MPFKEKSAWIMVVITVAAYTTYVTSILARSGTTPLAQVPYVSTLFWTIGAVIVAAIVAHIAIAIASPEDADREDQRDREIERFGENVGHWFLVGGAMAALGMSMLEMSYFWISNAIYLAFVLSASLGSAAKVLAYRRGFQQW